MTQKIYESPRYARAINLLDIRKGESKVVLPTKHTGQLFSAHKRRSGVLARGYFDPTIEDHAKATRVSWEIKT
jgi:hypothetical protein